MAALPLKTIVAGIVTAALVGGGAVVVLSSGDSTTTTTQQTLEMFPAAGPPPDFASPPALPDVYGSVVRLSPSSCTQRVSVRARTTAAGGKGVVILSAVSPVPAVFHFVTYGGGVPIFKGRMYPGYWQKLTFAAPGTYVSRWGSSFCPTTVNAAGKQLYTANATVVTVVVS